jgi:hypothetical protein
MTTQRVTLSIVDQRSSDADLLELSVQSLRKDLLEITGIYDIPSQKVAPPNAKGAVEEIIGTLVIAVPASVPVLKEMRVLLHDWLHRNDGKRVRIEVAGKVIDVTGLSDEILEGLVLRETPPDATP